MAHDSRGIRISGHIMRVSLSLLVLTTLTACSSLAGNSVAPEQRVEARAGERWQALIDGDIETAYSYLTPAYRSGNSVDDYRSTLGGAVRWLKQDVKEVDCKAERCVVGVDVKYMHPRLGMENTRRLTETWLRSEGEWWFYPSD
ncbi:hypothetical protein [Arhodomonas sp. AD133]|uniref:hypothetical protein n=1 Tax=Arhodomonas sp. AD133 TaxID=3415009 RepID=UPI003EB7F912